MPTAQIDAGQICRGAGHPLGRERPSPCGNREANRHPTRAFTTRVPACGCGAPRPSSAPAAAAPARVYGSTGSPPPLPGECRLEIDRLHRLRREREIVVMPHPRRHAIPRPDLVVPPLGDDRAAPFENDVTLVAIVVVAVERCPLRIIHRVALVRGILDLADPEDAQPPVSSHLPEVDHRRRLAYLDHPRSDRPVRRVRPSSPPPRQPLPRRTPVGNSHRQPAAARAVPCARTRAAHPEPARRSRTTSIRTSPVPTQSVAKERHRLTLPGRRRRGPR